MIFSIKTSQNASPLLGNRIQQDQYACISLAENRLGQDFEKTADPKFLDEFIQGELKNTNVEWGIGGYLEKRGIYRSSPEFFGSGPERCYHLGIDIWAKAGTEIYCPLPATVHSFKYNDKPYDYGGTIIMQHQMEGQVFHTLYGHLSKDSLVGLEVGQVFPSGKRLCRLGDWNENGGWPPHLHFQVIIDLQGNTGDYAGVSSLEDLEFYKENCPNPFYLCGFE